MKVDDYLNHIDEDNHTDPPSDEPREDLVEHLLRPDCRHRAAISLVDYHCYLLNCLPFLAESTNKGRVLMAYSITEIEDRVPMTTATAGRFRFSILCTPRGLPVCELSYRTEDDANEAREAAQIMIQNAAG
jgi:hypothetical protein